MDFGYTQVNSLPSLQTGISVTTPKLKPAIPKKPIKLIMENESTRTSHVKDIVRKLQEKGSPNATVKKANFFKMGVKESKSLPMTRKEEVDVEASNQTLEDLKAIDEDIEKLRKQIEERDKIISALREAAEVKDKKLDNLMIEFSKSRSSEKLDLDTSTESNRANLSSPSSPPLCNGELCWTDSFVNKNYHEPVYAQLLNDHTALQKIYKELRAKLETKGKEFERLEEETLASQADDKMANHENAINLIMAEQIRILKEREAQLVTEAEELREQRDLMEFRILELEECRKEFLDKEEINGEKHRNEKIVWAERDIEDISDSGVMSLPTSEDLTSDSELGDAIRNYSPLGAVTNLSLLSPETTNSDSDLKIKKSLKSSECLQESGIFEDSEPPSESAILPTKQTRGCQTESILDKTLLDFIDSSCDLLLTRNRSCQDQKCSDDLSTEISKLSVIQKRIQQKTTSPTPKRSHTVFTCPHTNSVLFYEERLAQLEDKLKIYESSGDTKDHLLAKRLEKEIELACRVKELTEKVATLEVTNRRLEEEKCEFEEAENDARFQCQRLEVRLQELLDKNTELEVELDRQKEIMNEERRREKKKGSLETLISRYEQRNFELEEREVEAKQKLSMMEAAIPAIVAWNMFQMIQNPDFNNTLPGSESRENVFVEDKKNQDQEAAMFRRLEELLDGQKKLRKDYEKVEETAADRERLLRTKIEELELKAAKDREMLDEMTNSLKALKSEEKCDAGTSNLFRPEEFDLIEELNRMIANEIQLRAEIERLEKKEEVYMNSLESADEIWASMEAGYKKRLKEAEAASEQLKERVARLEATQMELEKALEDQKTLNWEKTILKKEISEKSIEPTRESNKLGTVITKSLEKVEERKKFLEKENINLKEELAILKCEFAQEEKKYLLLQKDFEIARVEAEREKEISDRLRIELEDQKRSINAVEKNLQNQISNLNHELTQKGKELSNLEVTVAELREEVETLESKVAELVEAMHTIPISEEGNSKVSSRIMAPFSSTIQKLNRTIVGGTKNFSTQEERKPFNEILVKTESALPRLNFLTASKHKFRWIVFAASILPRQEIKFVFPRRSLIRQVQMIKNEKSFPTVTTWMHNSSQTLGEQGQTRDEEIFQLSIKNIELQQVLEKMEEESRLKEKELEELQNIALQIRKEQLSLELQYEGKTNKGENVLIASDEIVLSTKKSTKSDESQIVCKVDDATSEKSIRSRGIDIMQIIDPNVVKTSDELTPSLSNIRIALNNLQNKCRIKNFVIKSLLDELHQKGDNLDCEELFKQLLLQYPAIGRRRWSYADSNSNTSIDTASCQGTEHNDKIDIETKSTAGNTKARSSTPNYLGRSSSASYSISLDRKLPDASIDFSFVAPIRTLRKVGDDGIFLEWDVTHKPDNVTGYEILVNGKLSHHVRSSTRNKALLHSLNLTERIFIQLFAMSENGPSTKYSHVTYPDGHRIYRTESL